MAVFRLEYRVEISHEHIANGANQGDHGDRGQLSLDEKGVANNVAELPRQAEQDQSVKHRRAHAQPVDREQDYFVRASRRVAGPKVDQQLDDDDGQQLQNHEAREKNGEIRR